MERYRRWTIVFVVLAVLMVCFIFGNSLQGSEESNGRSGVISAFLKQLIDPAGRMDDVLFHIIIRKLAHFTEFAGLGLCLGGMAYNMGRWRHRVYISLPILLALLVAVTDEFIQQYTGRTSAVKDIVIDFSGALFGLLVVVLLVAATQRKGAQKIV